MKNKLQPIHKKANQIRFFRYCLQSMMLFSVFAGLLILVMHRVFGIDGAMIPIGILSTIFIGWRRWQRNPISIEEMRLWAEMHSGGAGYLFLKDSEPLWQSEIDGQSQNIPQLQWSVQQEIKEGVVAVSFMVGMLFVPLKTDTPLSSNLIQQEKSDLLEQIEMLSEILVEEDAELTELSEQVAQLDAADSVQSNLETLDAMFDQVAQKEADLAQALQQMEQALHNSNPHSLQEASQNLQTANALSQSQMSELAQNEFALSEEQKEALASQVQKQQEKLRQSKMLQESASQMSNMQKGTQHSSQNNSDGQSQNNSGQNNSGQSERGEQSQNGQNSSNGGSQQDSNNAQSDDEEPGLGQGSQSLNGDIRALDFRQSKDGAALLQTLPQSSQVDWEYTVMLGQGMGIAVSSEQSTSTSTNPNIVFQNQNIAIQHNEIPPNQRVVVKDFFQESP